MFSDFSYRFKIIVFFCTYIDPRDLDKTVSILFVHFFVGKLKMAATGHQKWYNRYIFGDKQYRNLNSESFLYVLKYEESSATIILMKEI